MLHGTIDARYQKAERLNVAKTFLLRGKAWPRQQRCCPQGFGLSRRQAYRYLQEAQEIGHLVVVSEASVPITLKIPGSVARELPAYANHSSGLALGEIVARAVLRFLSAARKHG